ncbi:MAG: peptidoglycan editing factor PgeF [Deltaproteobacteria bacterium]|nr:peptidoglycan editing factor PgeF [Deltaproteobacteria bacterium]
MITSRLLASHGIRHGFSTREGGVSAPPFDTMNLARNVGDDPTAVAENHARLARAIGYDVERLFEASQVHGVRLIEVDGREAADVRREEADALVTTSAGRAVGVRTADCVPLLVGDPSRRIACAIHAGWRGAVEGIVPRAIASLLAHHGVGAESLVVAIGPHIRVASFEVGDEVVDAITKAMPRGSASAAVVRGGPPIVEPPGARPHASLATLVIAQLLDAGIRDAHIDDVGGDTCSEAARFHSHRRDAARSGRQLSVIVAG